MFALLCFDPLLSARAFQASRFDESGALWRSAFGSQRIKDVHNKFGSHVKRAAACAVGGLLAVASGIERHV